MSTTPETTAPATQEQQVDILSVPINDQNTALQIMVAFLNVAQRRSAFSIEESARIWDAMKFFMVKVPAAENTMDPSTTIPFEEVTPAADDSESA
jgi:hypothetical protein